MRQLALLMAVLASTAYGQAAPPAAMPTSWGIGVGAEITSYSSPLTLIPTVSVMGCWTGLCEITTIENGSTIATLRQEIGYKVKQSADGSSMLIVLAGGGLTGTTSAGGLLPSSVTLGAVGGGVALVYDLGALIKPLKGQGVRVKLSMREAAVTSLGVKPQYQAELVYRFK